MSLQDYRSAKLLIEDNGGDFEGTKPEELITKAEQALGIKFPPSYRLFLSELGCGDINGLEVYGIINDHFEISRVPNGIWLTLHERQNISLLPNYILIGESGDGSYIALDASRKDNIGENPVVRLSLDGQQSETVATSFGVYLLDSVQSVV
jgi:antitoxin YobK